jgi:hypothetical protein
MPSFHSPVVTRASRTAACKCTTSRESTCQPTLSQRHAHSVCHEVIRRSPSMSMMGKILDQGPWSSQDASELSQGAKGRES